MVLHVTGRDPSNVEVAVMTRQAGPGQFGCAVLYALSYATQPSFVLDR
jgi:hypothetical protein